MRDDRIQRLQAQLEGKGPRHFEVPACRPARPYACLPACLSKWLFAYLPVCMYVCLDARCSHACLPVCKPAYTCLHACFPGCLFFLVLFGALGGHCLGYMGLAATTWVLEYPYCDQLIAQTIPEATKGFRKTLK